MQGAGTIANNSPMPQLPLRFARYREIAAEVAERLNAVRPADPLAPWPLEVLVPSRGMAEAIARELLSGNQQPATSNLALHRLEDVARRLVNASGDFPRVASEGERRLAMRAAVRSIDDPMMTTRGIAAMLERSYRDVRDGGMSLADVKVSPRLRNPVRTRLIVRAWTEYERLIAQLGAIDPAELFARATRLVIPSVSEGPGRVGNDDAHAPTQVPRYARDDSRYLLAGFYDMTGMQFRFVEALRDAGRLAGAWVPVDSGDAYTFASSFVAKLGVDSVLSPQSSVLRVRSPQTSVVAHDTRFSELQATAHAVRSLLDAGVAPRSIAVVSRSVDPYDARLFHRFAASLGFTTSWTEETPLSAHRLGRGIVSLLRLRDRGFPRAEVLELVRDGLKTKTRLDVDRVDEETRRSRIAGGTSEELHRVRRKRPAVEDYIALVAELEQLTASIDVALLEKLPGMFHLESELDLAAAEAIDQIADLFRGTAVWNRGFDASAVIDAIENSVLSPQSSVLRALPTIWLGDVMKFRGRTFEHVFVVRMQDDVFPQRRNEDPLLPDSDRRALGMREIGDGHDEERLLFQLLFDGALASVRFSYASTDGFGKVLRASRLVKQLPVDGSRLPEQPRQPSTVNRQLRPLQLLTRTGTRSQFDGYLPPTLLRERVLRALQSVSPTQLEDFGECPQKFLLKHVLGVSDVDDPEREVQIHHREKGTLDHRILERFYRGLDDDTIREAAAQLPRLSDDIGARLDALIDQQFDDFEADYPPFNRTVRAIERRATKRILREFIAFDLGELAANALLPRHFEYRFGRKYVERGDAVSQPESFTVDTHGVTLRVDGTIDRIDSDGERFRIIDYKSGKALRHRDLGRKIDRGVRLQLALYAMAVARFFGVEAAKVSGAIRPIVVSAEAKPQTFAFALAEKETALLETLEIFVRAILDGHFPAFPNERDEDFNSCKYCPVNHSCRTKHDLDERYAVQQRRDPRTLLQEGR